MSDYLLLLVAAGVVPFIPRIQVRRRAAAVWIGLFAVAGGVTAASPEWRDYHEEAEKTDRGALLERTRRFPDDPGAWYLLALRDLTEHRLEEAGVAFERVRRLAPSEPWGAWGLAEIARRAHRVEEAREVFEGLIRDRPDYIPPYLSLAYLCFEVRDFNRAIRLAMSVVRQGPRKVDGANLSRAYLLVGGAKGMIAEEGGAWSKLIQGTQVMPYLRKAEGIRPETPELFFGLGSFYVRAPSLAGGNKAKGLEYLEKAIVLDPNFADAHARIAEYWCGQGEFEKCDASLARAASLDPKNMLYLKVRELRKGL